jgi:hypothetical protein
MIKNDNFLNILIKSGSMCDGFATRKDFDMDKERGLRKWRRHICNLLAAIVVVAIWIVWIAATYIGLGYERVSKERRAR